MQRVNRFQVSFLVAGAILLLAAATAGAATFVADEPGSALVPIDDAGDVIKLIQGQQELLWVSLTGPVTQVAVWGWPVSDGEVELGGGMSVTRLDGGAASGIVETPDPPSAISFSY